MISRKWSHLPSVHAMQTVLEIISYKWLFVNLETHLTNFNNLQVSDYNFCSTMHPDRGVHGGTGILTKKDKALSNW